MSQSSRLFEQAKQTLVGGVNSPVRAFKGVGGTPIFMASGKGAYITDADEKSYIDYVQSWGPMILGHAHPDVTESTIEAIKKGTSFGTSTAIEAQLAEKIMTHVPSIEKIRLVNSGTEATMSALRLARGYTNKSKIIKFEGCYHGHSDGLLVEAGSGALTNSIPGSKGVTKATAEQTLTARYNDTGQVEQLFQKFGDDIAAVILEPVCGNMGVIIPEPKFIQTVRDLCNTYNSILIFDEVMSGFRVSMGGAQAYLGVTPDLTTLGKVIGGGLPCGAYGGKAEIMQHLSPEGDVYQAGTLSGNPVVCQAGLTTLEILEQPGTFQSIVETTSHLVKEITTLLKNTDIPHQMVQAGTMFCLFFTNTPVRNLHDAKTCNTDMFNRYFHAMCQNGVYLPPSQFEANFVSLAHTPQEVSLTLEAIKKSLNLIQ